MNKVIAFIGGCGKLGLPLSCWAAHQGFTVYAADLNQKAVDMVNAGISPIYEPGIEDFVMAHGKSGDGKLRATTEILGSCAIADYIGIIVPTPSLDDGSFSTAFVEDAARMIADSIKMREDDVIPIIILISTVNPGDTRRISGIIEGGSEEIQGQNFDLIYSPELLALGNAIHGISKPDVVLIGASRLDIGQRVWSEFYKPMVERAGSVYIISWESAEIAKIGLNAALVTKTAVANQLMWLCDKVPHASAENVCAVIGGDPRIGPKFFTPGLWPGGPCLPRDNRALSHAINKWGSKVSVIADASDAASKEQLNALCGKIARHNGRIGILGLTYKTDVDIPDEGMGIWIAKTLMSRHKRKVAVYDPQIKAVVGLTHATSMDHLLSLSDTIVIATAWPEFQKLTDYDLSDKTVVDCWKLLGWLEHNAGHYIQIGENDA